MPRPIILFSGQWTDLPLEELADAAAPPIAGEPGAVALPPTIPAVPESDPPPYTVAGTTEADDDDLFPEPGEMADATPPD